MILNLFESDRIEWGKRHYKEISDLRVDLETTLAKDLIDLYDVKRFLKYKKKKLNNNFVPIEVASPILKQY